MSPLVTKAPAKNMKSIWIALALLGTLMAASPARAVEEPRWTSVFQDGAFQVRDYAPTVVAETSVNGERGAAINQGFQRLARYIFGGNQTSQDIAMTAPVAQQPSGRRIAMTAPVAQAPGDGGWTVTFFMPPGSELEDMPRPLDTTVTLRTQPARRMATLRFSGLATRDNLDRHGEELLRRVESRGDVVIGATSYAFYDPPWTLPWAHRNEVMVEVQRPGHQR